MAVFCTTLAKILISSSRNAVKQDREAQQNPFLFDLDQSGLPVRYQFLCYFNQGEAWLKVRVACLPTACVVFLLLQGFQYCNVDYD